MEEALSVGFSTAEDYRNLWMSYIDYMRRRIDWDADHQSTELEELRGTFNRACEHLAQCECPNKNCYVIWTILVISFWY
jgi:hypothetical protein